MHFYFLLDFNGEKGTSVHLSCIISLERWKFRFQTEKTDIISTTDCLSIWRNIQGILISKHIFVFKKKTLFLKYIYAIKNIVLLFFILILLFI